MNPDDRNEYIKLIKNVIIPWAKWTRIDTLELNGYRTANGCYMIFDLAAAAEQVRLEWIERGYRVILMKGNTSLGGYNPYYAQVDLCDEQDQHVRCSGQTITEATLQTAAYLVQRLKP